MNAEKNTPIKIKGVASKMILKNIEFKLNRLSGNWLGSSSFNWGENRNKKIKRRKSKIAMLSFHIFILEKIICLLLIVKT